MTKPKSRRPVESLQEFLARHPPRPKSPEEQAEWRERIERARRRERELMIAFEEREAERKLALQIVNAGYRAVAMKLHPDQGGPQDAMTRLINARNRLKLILKHDRG